MTCIRQKCEEWLLTEFEFRIAEVSPHYVDVKSCVEYFMKCVYYGEKYGLEKLYASAFKHILPFQLKRYMQNEYYLKLPEKTKRELLENRLCKIEEDVRTNSYVAPRTGFVSLKKNILLTVPTYTKDTKLSVSSDIFQ